jgi:aryl-phospho-beta-D-glucosidase BglC (GH1 family)
MRVFEGFQKGVNLGGWISQFDVYDPAHFESFITEKDIRDIASLGFDHVRVPVDYVLLEEEDGTEKEDGFRYLEQCRKWCEDSGLHMLIDLHECYGYSFDPLKKGMDRERFFYDEALQGRFLHLWQRIAERFSDHQDMVAFEPLNEVVLQEVADAWNKVASSYIRMMRTIVPDSYLVIGGVRYSSVASVPLLELDLDDRIVYNFHCYEPFIFTHQGAYWVENMPSDFRTGYPRKLEEYREIARSWNLQEEVAGLIYKDGVSEIGEAFFEQIFEPALRKAQKDQVPLYCGEYGVIDLADSQDTLRWLKDIHAVMKRHGIGRALWNYKEKDFGFVGESFSSIREDFIKAL